MNLFTGCKPSETDRLTDADWKFKVKLYTTILNVVMNNIFVVRLVEYDKQMTNFKFISVMYYYDLILVGLFMFISAFMFWTKIFFGKIWRFDESKDVFTM